MYKYLFAILLMYCALCLCAQSKRDHIWLLGASNINYPQGGMYLRFASDSATIEKVNFTTGLVHATCNDEDGNLLFYYNFCKIANKAHQVMENGDDMNVGSYAFTHDCADYGIDLIQRSGALIFPIPDQPKMYYLLHIRTIKKDNEPYSVIDLLQSTKVDMSANNGLGKVVEKDLPVMSDSLHDAIAAVRHGNGRDWWIIVPRGTGREFWEMQLTPNGLSAPALISFNRPPPSDPFFEYARESWGAQARFSPDGSKYVRYSRGNGAEIYDFNRCTGVMTFRRMLPEPPSAMPDQYPVAAGGICISPNSRYLYFDNVEFLFQFDLCEENLNNPNSEPILIDEWRPGPVNSTKNTFFLMRNAPDGKIYMNSTNSCFSLHVINKPDLPGKACEFVQAGFQLPLTNSWIWSDFQNFNLYNMADSPCDSLGIDDPNPPAKLPDIDKLTIYPNPANEEVNIFIPGCELSSLLIYNVSGILIEKIPIVDGNFIHTISTRDWSAGVYFFKFQPGKEGGSSVAKLVVVH